MKPTEAQITAIRIDATNCTYDYVCAYRHEFTDAVIRLWESIRPKDDATEVTALKAKLAALANWESSRTKDDATEVTALKAQLDALVAHHTRSIISHAKEVDALKAELASKTPQP